MFSTGSKTVGCPQMRSQPTCSTNYGSGVVIGRYRLELTGIGIYHAGNVNRGLLG